VQNIEFIPYLCLVYTSEFCLGNLENTCSLINRKDRFLLKAQKTAE